MRQWKWLRLLAVFLAFALVAAACGSDDDDGDAAAPAAEADAEGAATDGGDSGDDAEEAAADDSGDDGDSSGDDADDSGDAEEPDEDEADDSAALGNVEVDEEAANCATAIELEVGAYDPGPALTTGISVALGTGWNPHNDQAPAQFSWYGWVFEGLVRLDTDGTVVPWLAKCFETNEAGDVITFFLHENITFQDGSPLNAEAVKANIDFIKGGEPPQVLPPVTGQLAIVDSVEVVDDLTVQFNLTAPGEALLLSGLIRNSGFLVSPAALGSAGEMPLGTGPYMVASTNADNTVTELVAYDGYWQPQLVGAEAVTLNAVPDAQARVDGLNAGQFDIVVINAPQVDAVPAFSSNDTVRVGFVVADWTGETIPALANRDVRCAMGQALNRVGIQEAFNLPASTANNQFATGPDDYAYIDDLDVADFDIEAAKAAFEATGEAGFEFTNGHLPFGFWPVVASAWSGALSELGITMNNEALDPPSGGEMFSRLARGQYPVQIIAYNEPNALMSLIARTGEAAFNPSGVSPEGVVELVASARTKSFEDGEAEVAEAWKIMLEECIFIIQQTLPTFIAYGEDVQGVAHVTGLPITYWPHGVRKG